MTSHAGAIVLLLALLVANMHEAFAFTEAEAKAQLERAESFFEKQQWSQAAEAAEKARKEDPGLADAYVLLGLIATRQSRLTAAEALFRDAIRIEPSNYRTLSYLATTLLQQGRSKEAAIAFHQVLAMNANDAVAQYNLGVIALSSGSVREAKEANRYFSAVARTNPSDVPALVGVLESALALKNVAAARDSASDLNRLLPALDPDRLRLAALLGSHSEYQAVVSLLEPASAAGSTSADISYNLALAHFNLGQYDSAQTSLRNALRPPRRADAVGLLGEIEAARHHDEEALLAFEEATTLSPSDEDAWFNLGSFLIGQNKTAFALDVFRNGLSHVPAAQRLQLGLAAACFLSGMHKEAVSNLLPLARDPSHTKFVFYLLGEAYPAAPAEETRIADAFASYLKQKPDDPWAYYNYGRILFLQAQAAQGNPKYSGSIENLKAALRMNPKMAEAFLKLAEIAHEQGRLPDSVALLQRALALKPELFEAHYKLALAYQKLGRQEEASNERKLFQAQKAANESRMNQDISRQLREAAKK